MIKVDGLEPTPEMEKPIEMEKRGEITMEQVREVLDQRYKMKVGGQFMRDPYFYPDTEILKNRLGCHGRSETPGSRG